MRQRIDEWKPDSIKEEQGIKKTFPGYYPFTQEEISALWDDCVFVFDANVFLDLYRYSPRTRNELIDILTSIAERIWTPHQVVLEFLKNRPGVILTQVSMYEKAKSILKGLHDRAREEINKELTFRNHPFIDKQELLCKIEDALGEIGKALDQDKQNHPQDLTSQDSVLESIADLFQRKVGPPYSPKRLKEIYKEGEERYAPEVFPGEVPPGYEDAQGPKKKKGYDKYGDLVLWLQIIDEAKQAKRPVIFITNDTTEDWWWIAKGRTIGPRPELVAEMMAEANVSFHMYNSDRFMSYAREYLGIEVQQEAIDEVEDVIKEDTEDRKAMLREYIEAWEAARRRSGLPVGSGYHDIQRTKISSEEAVFFDDEMDVDEIAL